MTCVSGRALCVTLAAVQLSLLKTYVISTQFKTPLVGWGAVWKGVVNFWRRIGKTEKVLNSRIMDEAAVGFAKCSKK